MGAEAEGFAVGDRVYGLSGGGGYGQLATIDHQLAMPIPGAWDYAFAAAIPEVFFTANTAINDLGALQPGERALIHGGGSGVGIAAIQIARLLGGEAWITAGSDEKCAQRPRARRDPGRQLQARRLRGRRQRGLGRRGRRTSSSMSWAAPTSNATCGRSRTPAGSSRSASWAAPRPRST